MAVTQITSSDYSAAMKYLQRGAITDLLHEEDDFFKIIKTRFNRDTIKGKQIILAAREYLGHPAVKNVAFNGSFASRAKVGYQNLTVNAKYITGHVEMDAVEMEQAKGEGTWVNLLEDEIAAKNRAMAQQLSRQCFGDGSGVVGQVLSVVDDGSTGTITLDTSSTAQGSVYWFGLNDEYEILDADDSYNAHGDLDGGTDAAIRVTVIDLPNNAITCVTIDSDGTAGAWAPGTALAAGDLIIRKDITYTASATVADTASEEMMGFDGIISTDTTTLFGLSRSTVPIFKGQVSDLSGDLLQLEDLHTLAKNVGLAGGKPNLILVSYDSYLRLASLGESMRSVISSPDLNVQLGIKTIHYNSPTGGSIPIVISRYCPPTRIFMLDTKYFDLLGDEPKFIEYDGKAIRMKPSSSGGWENKLCGELFGILALACRAPNKSGKMIGFVNSETD